MALQTKDYVEEFIPKHSPTILNASNHPMVVFQERGTFYNCQVLKPGEAVSMTRKQTGCVLVPYKVHVIVGDENCLPSSKDSTKNLIKVTAIPAAFVAGCFATAISAGMLVGPSVALAPLVSGMVVNGVVIDSAALVAGGLMATRAQAATDLLLKEKPDLFMSKTGSLRPGQRYLVVTGGLVDGSVNIEEVSKKKFDKKFSVALWKPPLSNKVMSHKPVKASAENCLTEDDSREDTELLEGGGKVAQIAG